MEKNMSPVQPTSLTDEELIRIAYIEHTDPLVLELCNRIARLIDKNDELEAHVKELIAQVHN